MIAFVSSREVPDTKEANGAQIWLQDPRGGAARPLTTLDNSIEDFEWLSKKKLLVAAREKKTHYEEAQDQLEEAPRVVEDTTEFYPVRLFTVNVQTGHIKRITTNEGHIESFAASPSGRYVVYSRQTSPVTADARQQPRQYLLDLQRGTATEIFAKRYFDPSNFKWTPGGSGFYATDSYASDPEHEGAGIELLYFYDLSRRDYVQVPLQWEWGMGYGGYAVTPEGVHVQLANGTRMKPRFFSKDGLEWTPKPVEDYRLQHSTSLEVGPEGQHMVFAYSRADSIPRYYAARYEQGRVEGAHQFVKLNQYLKQLPVPKAEVIRWEGARGDTVNGLLYYPQDYEPGRRYPLMTVIHGGPSSAVLDVWDLGWTVYAPLWAQRGAFVFRPNYHGSSHHGLEFVESIKENYYELEIPDIVKGIRHLASKGMVDRDSLGTIGWSNGAILTIQLTTEHPEMFKAAAPGAGDVNWISDYGNCSFGVQFDQSYFGGAPWNNVDTYIRKSPLFEMEEVRAPTLIQFGAEDRTVPTEQGWQHYRALQQIGKAPVRFILYPDERHGLARLSHQRRKVEEDLAWFDTYLFGETSMQERVADRRLPDDAPLARLGRMQEIARAEGYYGERIGGVLAPEVVTFGDTLRVGRFEVTRAQWQYFQSDYDVAPDHENYPITRVGFEQARAYVHWLREQTGRPYRLPTKKELEAIQKRAAGSSENTLAYWAGYKPTPSELKALKARMAEVSARRLLMPVGSRPPGKAGSEHAPFLFDVGGNAAEWAVQEGGSGTVEGASAMTLPDDRAPEMDVPPSAFIGLRVVMGE